MHHRNAFKYRDVILSYRPPLLCPLDYRHMSNKICLFYPQTVPKPIHKCSVYHDGHFLFHVSNNFRRFLFYLSWLVVIFLGRIMLNVSYRQNNKYTLIINTFPWYLQYNRLNYVQLFSFTCLLVSQSFLENVPRCSESLEKSRRARHLKFFLVLKDNATILSDVGYKFTPVYSVRLVFYATLMKLLSSEKNYRIVFSVFKFVLGLVFGQTSSLILNVYVEYCDISCTWILAHA